MQNHWHSDYPGMEVSYTSQKSVDKPMNEHHCHDMYEILYVVTGRGSYIVEGQHYDLRPGTVMVVPPYAYHGVSVPLGEAYERYVINFSGTFPSQEALRQLDNVLTGHIGCYSSSPLAQAMVGIIERYELASRLPEDRRKLYAQMLLSEILILLSACNAEAAKEEDPELGARVIPYLNEHIGDDLNLDRIARHFFVSKYYLCRAFKKHNGVSIHGFVSQKRVMYAKQLMEAGETASGAAYRVGFGDYSAFYRAYVKVTGTSPAAAQKNAERQKRDETES